MMTGAQLFVLIAGVTGFVFLMIGGLMLSRVLRSATWVKTEGRVVSSRLQRVTHEFDGFEPHIEYEYSVGGRLYYSSRWRLAGPGTGSETNLQPYLRRYPRGRQVSVYYNPNNPEEATIERNRGSLIPYLLLFFGIFFIAGAIAVYLNPGLVRSA